MKKTATTLLSLFLLASSEAHEKQSKVQIALLLDTSSSMDGLISQTRSQLWKVVNTFTEAEQNGKVPFVEVALYEYGNNDLKAGQNFIRQVQPLTRDLDQISADLFSLKTNGGEEYCGAVIERAIEDLKWDSSGDTYKAIFIAGNEAFTQGPVDASQACRDAIERGVVVNTIHCGAHHVGVQGGWNDGAQLAEGSFTVINQDQQVAHIIAPQDEKILKLNERLNSTYLPFGENGIRRQRAQVKQDANARSKQASGALLQRSLTKMTSNYWNGSWDLVDASSAKDFALEKLRKDELPSEMQDLSPEEQKAFIGKKRAQRSEIQKQIKELNEERQVFVAEKRKQQQKGGAPTLDEAIAKTVREQAIKKGYQFRK